MNMCDVSIGYLRGVFTVCQEESLIQCHSWTSSWIMYQKILLLTITLIIVWGCVSSVYPPPPPPYPLVMISAPNNIPRIEMVKGTFRDLDYGYVTDVNIKCDRVATKFRDYYSGQWNCVATPSSCGFESVHFLNDELYRFRHNGMEYLLWKGSKIFMNWLLSSRILQKTIR